MAEQRLQGKTASTGFAIGPLVRLEEADVTDQLDTTTSDDEQEPLRAAMAKAEADLEALAKVASGDGAEILSFQREMLTDPALIEDVLIKIEQGQSALSAWEEGLEEQIVGYEEADDDYFRARASDLTDLKDRVARALLGLSDKTLELPDGAILLAGDLTPSRFLALDHEKLGGVALLHGSVNSHVSMLARARGLPMVVSLCQSMETVKGHATEAILDTERGLLVAMPTSATRSAYEERHAETVKLSNTAEKAKHQPAITRDGHLIDVLINIDDPDAIDDETLGAADGVGLLRTEFLFLTHQHLPNEDEQYQAYSKLLDRIADRQAIIRTLDVGGDKPLPGLGQAKEANPFLGLRGIRLCLEHEALFRVQVRALLRAAWRRPLRVMLPMVTVQAEIDQAKAIFEACLSELQAEGIKAELPPIGIMIETPAAAIAVDHLDADFYSIGSNDLIQYVMAAARDASGAVGDLLDPGHPAIKRLIGRVVAHGHALGREVSLCGDMASDPALLPSLLHAGLRKLSVAPAALGRIKAEIGKVDLARPSAS